MGFCLIQYLSLEKNFQRKKLFINVCGHIYAVSKGNRLRVLTMMKQLPFLFMLQQFTSLHLLRKFPVLFRTAPVTTLGPFPLVLESSKGMLLRLTSDGTVLDTRSTLLIEES